ncbi:response regulator transcription factor [Cohnella fermenti]|nr:response regulator [Cohnella fermenti]
MLIVDDERTTRNTLLNHIPWRELGIGEVEQADDGIRALELAKRHSPDIVMTDIRMPRMDGLTFARELRACLPKSKVIILSAYSEVDYLKSAIKLNVVDYVEKPIDLDEVKRVLASAVAKCAEEQARFKENEPPVQRDAAAPLREPGAEGGGLVGKAKRFIEQRACDPNLSISALADHLYLTPSYVCLIFKQETGITINQYLTSVRIGKAKERIADPAVKLHQVAGLVGYTDGKYFARLFKKECGLTPSEFRRTINP